MDHQIIQLGFQKYNIYIIRNTHICKLNEWTGPKCVAATEEKWAAGGWAI